MRQDPTFKDIFAYHFMVEELLRWFVAGIPGGRELVDGLDFSRLLRGCRSSPLRDRRRVSAPTLRRWRARGADPAASRARLDAPAPRELLEIVLLWSVVVAK